MEKPKTFCAYTYRESKQFYIWNFNASQYLFSLNATNIPQSYKLLKIRPNYPEARESYIEILFNFSSEFQQI